MSSSEELAPSEPPAELEWDKLPLPEWQFNWHDETMVRLMETETSEYQTYDKARKAARAIMEEVYGIAGIPQQYLRGSNRKKPIGLITNLQVGDTPTSGPVPSASKEM